MSRANVDKIIELQNQRLQSAKKLSKAVSEDKKELLKKDIDEIKDQIAHLNTKDPEAAKRLKKLLKELPNVPTSCDCMGDHH
ncbi:MAG: hypothetical protein U9Q33_06550 [Campylobacterota bacterium]|nr:hypothetical protein [Campylobacterota bacterium]